MNVRSVAVFNKRIKKKADSESKKDSVKAQY